MITENEFLEQISKIEENGYTIRKHIQNKLSVLLKKQQLKQMDYQIFNSSDSQMAKVVFQTYSKDQQSSQQANLKDTSSCNQNTIEDQKYQKSNNQEIVQDFKNMKFNSQMIDQGLKNVEFKNKDIIQGFDAMEVNNEEAVQCQLQSYDQNNLDDYQNNQLDHKMIIKKWDINEFNNNNKNLSQHFKKKQSEIVQKLSEFSLFLEQCILCKENEDIFEGYKSFDNKTIQSLTFIIKYYPSKQEVNQELRIIRDLEKYQQNKQFQLIQLQEQNITIFQFQQEKFSYYQNKMERAISLKKNWSKQYFDHLNENKQLNFQFCQQCQGCYCYLELKNYGKALNYFLTYLELQKQNVNENNSQALEMLNAIDFCYQNLQDINMALQYRFEILEILNQNQQSNEKQIFNSMFMIGIYYRFLGQNQKAKEYLLKCYCF
ncbi:hypothetical protein ABPG72_019929 [Tetrahymena utriculariae]